MEVKCPQCNSRFNLSDAMARPGVKLRCTVCKNVFSPPIAPRTAAEKAGAGPARQRAEKLPEMARTKRGITGRVLILLLSLIVLAALGGGVYFYSFYMKRDNDAAAVDVGQNVSMLTMRNVRQYNVLNEKVGKVFVIEGKVINEFPVPKDFIELEGAIYDRSKKPLAIKKQLAGTQLSLFQLQVLSEKEMESFLNNKIEILANNTNVPTGGEVPFMILFYDPPETVTEFGVKIVDAKTSDGANKN